MDSEEWLSEDEDEEFKAAVIDKKRRQDEDDEDSFEGSAEGIAARPQSGRETKRSRMLDVYEVELDSSSGAAAEPVTPLAKGKKSTASASTAAKTVRKSADRRKTGSKSANYAFVEEHEEQEQDEEEEEHDLLAPARGTKAVRRKRNAVPKKAPKEAPKKAAAAGRKKAASPAPEKRISLPRPDFAIAPVSILKKVSAPKPSTKSVKFAVSAVSVAPAPAVLPAAVVPARKRQKFSAVLSKEDNARVIDAVEAEEAELIPDDELLVTPFAHVSNTIVDDYVRLLKAANGGWPPGFLVETTARWVQFQCEAEKHFELVLRLFAGANGERLRGVERVVWPMFGRGHFAVLDIDVKKQTIGLIDSIVSTRKCWKLGFLQNLLKRAFGWRKDAVVTFTNCRQQGNSDDCGVYTMGHVRSLIEKISIMDHRMPGTHMRKEKEGAVAALRLHFAGELQMGALTNWK